MAKSQLLCSKCRHRIRTRYPCGKTIYIGKKEPLDHGRLFRLLKQGSSCEELASKFSLTPRRIQQIAASRQAGSLRGSK